jgi:di/tricarboxylate transporter
MLPIAIGVALGLGANPQTFALATAIGASTSLLTPVGHQANVLLFGPGGYRFFDLMRVGAPLNLALFAVTMTFLPLIWALYQSWRVVLPRDEMSSKSTPTVLEGVLGDFL